MKIMTPRLARELKDRSNFHDALMNVMWTARYSLYEADEAARKENEREVYDFAIKAIGIELAVSPTVKYLLHGMETNMDIIPYVKPYKDDTVDMAGKVVLSFPWNRCKLNGSICDVNQKGFIKYPQNCKGVYYEELGLVHITNGFHHAAVAFIENTGEADLEIISLHNYFDTLTTDGAYWMCHGERTRCDDYRLAVLYELARQRNENTLDSRSD